MEVIYLRQELSDKLRDIRKTIRLALSSHIIMPDGSIADFMNDRSLNTLILNFAMSGILNNEEYFDLFMEAMNTRAMTEPLVKEYYYGPGTLGWKLLWISKRYNKKIGKHLLPKESKVIQGSLTTLFSKKNDVHLAVYMGIFVYGIKQEILSEESLDALLDRLGPNALEDVKDEVRIYGNLMKGLEFVYKSHDFALRIFEENGKIANGAAKILKDVYTREIDHIIPLTERYEELFEGVVKPVPEGTTREYDEISIISGIINVTFEVLESMRYVVPFDIVNPKTNRIIEELKEKGIDVTSSTKIANDPRGSLILQSLLNIVLYSMRKDKTRKIETIYIAISEKQSED